MNLLYQSQRAMRAKREEAMRRGVIAVLDIGTSRSRAWC
jgi:cell division protein FtsA